MSMELPDSLVMISQLTSFGSGPEFPATLIGNARMVKTISSTSNGLRPASAIKAAAVVSRLVTYG